MSPVIPMVHWLVALLPMAKGPVSMSKLKPLSARALKVWFV